MAEEHVVEQPERIRWLMLRKLEDPCADQGPFADARGTLHEFLAGRADEEIREAYGLIRDFVRQNAGIEMPENVPKMNEYVPFDDMTSFLEGADWFRRNARLIRGAFAGNMHHLLTTRSRSSQQRHPRTKTGWMPVLEHRCDRKVEICRVGYSSFETIVKNCTEVEAREKAMRQARDQALSEHRSEYLVERISPA